jgi:hypothetical protein
MLEISPAKYLSVEIQVKNTQPSHSTEPEPEPSLKVLPHKRKMGCTSSSQPSVPTAPTTGISLKTTGGLAPDKCMPNGMMKWHKESKNAVQDIQDGKRRTFILKGGKYNNVWTLHFSESLQLWYLGSTHAEDMVTMLEENKDMKKHLSCYVHDAGVPLSEGKWTMTSMPKYCVFSRDSGENTIEIGWIGDDIYGVEQYGVVGEIPVNSATNSEDVDLVDAGDAEN